MLRQHGPARVELATLQLRRLFAAIPRTQRHPPRTLLTLTVRLPRAAVPGDAEHNPPTWDARR